MHKFQHISRFVPLHSLVFVGVVKTQKQKLEQRIQQLARKEALKCFLYTRRWHTIFSFHLQLIDNWHEIAIFFAVWLLLLLCFCYATANKVIKVGVKSSTHPTQRQWKHGTWNMEHATQNAQKHFHFAVFLIVSQSWKWHITLTFSNVSPAPQWLIFRRSFFSGIFPGISFAFPWLYKYDKHFFWGFSSNPYG